MNIRSHDEPRQTYYSSQRLENQSRSPVFVVGMNGSGTSVLSSSLGCHPRIYQVPGETRSIPFLLNRFRSLSGTSSPAERKHVWEKARHDLLFRERNGGNPIPLPSDWDTVGESIGSIIAALFDWLAESAGKRRWCEKSPMHAQHIPLLASAFPGSRFVHVLRDGRDAAASFHRRFGYDPCVNIERWKQVVRKARSDGASLGKERYVEILYEGLTAEPETELRRICAFLDEDFSAAMLDPKVKLRQNPSSSGFRSNSQKWREYFSEPRIAQLEDQAGQLLHELGYTVTNVSGDSDLSPMYRRTQLIRDRIHRVIADTKLIFREDASLKRRVIRFASMVNSGLRQLLTTR